MNVDSFKKNIGLRIEQYKLLLNAKECGLIAAAIQLAEVSLKDGNKLLVFGNGGSATQSSHLAAELVNKFYFHRKGLAAIALTTDVANLTSIANDSDYRYIYSRQVEALGKEGDVAIGLSTSGTSPNVLEAFKAAKSLNIKTVALCGRNTRALAILDTDVIIPVQSEDTPVVQELHLFYLHTMAEFLEKNLCGG
ncbi:MAG: SIS domain-containing protein [bacterium]|nr:SIS domain-containing protein [bacterium]